MVRQRKIKGIAPQEGFAMLKKTVRGVVPALHPTVRGAESAAVIGAVTCGAEVNLWYGAVLRGDSDAITVGEGTNVQDNCVLHCDPGTPLTVGKFCTIGHGAIVHGCTVGDHVLIGMGATLLNGCKIGDGAIIGAGALVPGGMEVPPGMLVVGVPGKVLRPVKPEEQASQEANIREYLSLARESLPLAGE
jgi:carbonic anhydrase/acetyltransferase-like protein (isoleucine patch superfamily)